MKTSACFLLLILLLSSCSADRMGSASAPVSPAYSAPSASGGARSDRQIRKEGRLRMKSRALDDSAERCVALVTAHHGMLSTATLTEDDYDATIRVPAPSLEPLMKSLSGLGKVTSRKVSSEDVTEQYTDLEAEVRNQRALRDRLRQLLAKAETVKDTLAIEKELARVQTTLDQLEGRLKLLRSQVAMSTLNISIEREKIPGPLGVATTGTSWAVKKLFVIK